MLARHQLKSELRVAARSSSTSTRLRSHKRQAKTCSTRRQQPLRGHQAPPRALATVRARLRPQPSCRTMAYASRCSKTVVPQDSGLYSRPCQRATSFRYTLSSSNNNFSQRPPPRTHSNGLRRRRRARCWTRRPARKRDAAQRRLRVSPCAPTRPEVRAGYVMRTIYPWGLVARSATASTVPRQPVWHLHLSWRVTSHKALAASAQRMVPHRTVLRSKAHQRASRTTSRWARSRRLVAPALFRK